MVDAKCAPRLFGPLTAANTRPTSVMPRMSPRCCGGGPAHLALTAEAKQGRWRLRSALRGHFQRWAWHQQRLSLRIGKAPPALAQDLVETLWTEVCWHRTLRWPQCQAVERRLGPSAANFCDLLLTRNVANSGTRRPLWPKCWHCLRLHLGAHEGSVGLGFLGHARLTERSRRKATKSRAGPAHWRWR